MGTFELKGRPMSTGFAQAATFMDSWPASKSPCPVVPGRTVLSDECLRNADSLKMLACQCWVTCKSTIATTDEVAFEIARLCPKCWYLSQGCFCPCLKGWRALTYHQCRRKPNDHHLGYCSHNRKTAESSALQLRPQGAISCHSSKALLFPPTLNFHWLSCNMQVNAILPARDSSAFWHAAQQACSGMQCAALLIY